MSSLNSLKNAELGSFVELRGKPWLVEGISDSEGLSTLKLACISDDSQGEQLEILRDAEIGARVIDENDWSRIGQIGADDAKVLAAYIRTIRWKSATSADRKLFQSPFRAGIKLDAYQLLPLQKALELPRTNLLIADDVGLGKTIEAGLIVRELLLRRRIDLILVAAPPAMTIQWKDELETKFGLTFQIMDRERLRELRRLRGFSVNPWSTGSRFIISHRLLTDETYTSGLRDVLSEFRPGSLLILDEAHHAAPASKGGWGSSSRGVYAISSQLTRAVREISERFEHRLFLTATPHNGHSNSFSALLEMLDPQRFTRGVAVRPSDLTPIMVRRLKSDLRKLNESFPKRIIEPIIIENLPEDSPELQLSRLLSEFGELRMNRISNLSKGKMATSKLVFVNLQRRLLSSIAAFKKSLETYRATLERLINKELQTGRVPTVDNLEPMSSDESAELGIEDEEAESAIQKDEEAKFVNASIAGNVNSSLQDLELELEAVERMLEIANKHVFSPDARVIWLIDWIRANMFDGEDWNNRRLIIFTEWEDTRRWLEKRLREEFADSDDSNQRIDVFTGATGTERRETVKLEFNTDPKKKPLRILICTDAAREGINLQSYCSDLIHFDLPWNPARLEQRNGRIDRKLQPSDSVSCRYFIYKQRETDVVLQALYNKSETIHKELGSMSQVVGEKITRQLQDEGIFKGQASAIAEAITAENDMQGLEVVSSEMEGVDTDRIEKVKKELENVRNVLEQSRKKVGVDSTDLKNVVSTALLKDGLNLETKASEKIGETTTYEINETDKAFADDVRWAEVFDDLRERRRKKRERHNVWRQSTIIRKIAFEPPVREDGSFADDVVQVHLEHRLIRRLLSRFISQGFQSKLSRLSIIEGQGAQRRVILMGRLALYGKGAARLHEEIIPITAIWSDVERDEKRLKPLGQSGQSTTLDQLEDALKIAKMPDLSVEKYIKQFIEKDISDLRPKLESEAEKRLNKVQSQLKQFGEKEARDLKKLLESQRKRIEDAKLNSLQRKLEFDNESEQQEFEANQRHWDRRLEKIAQEIVDEPKLLQESFEVRSHRLEPVGIVYLWPSTG